MPRKSDRVMTNSSSGPSVKGFGAAKRAAPPANGRPKRRRARRRGRLLGLGADWSSVAIAAEDPRLAAASLACLFLAGATIGLLSLLLPRPPGANVGGLYSNVALAYVGGAVVFATLRHIRVWMLHVALVLGAVLITRAVLLSGDGVSFYSVWYIWIGLYAFFFFSRAVAASHVALVAGLYAVSLTHETPSSPVARWLTTVATLVVAGAFIDTLVKRARGQARAAAESATGMARVNELAHELAGLTDGGAARVALCRGAVRVTQAVRGVLWEPSRDGTGLRITASAGVDPSPHVIPSAGISESFHESRVVLDRYGDPPAGRLWQPVTREQVTVAVLELDWADPAVLEDLSTITLASLLGVEAAVTLQRIQLLTELEIIARTDELTGLPNRRAWQEQLTRELVRSERIDAPLSVAMLDLDHFKSYNDTHGHQTGDRLLKQAAAAWSAELRPTDILARYGGEEFALALPDCPLEEALVVVERLRVVMPEGLTNSAGIATWDGSEGAGDLLDRADQALYRAKRDGRNRSALAAEPVTGVVIPLK